MSPAVAPILKDFPVTFVCGTDHLRRKVSKPLRLWEGLKDLANEKSLVMTSLVLDDTHSFFGSYT